MFDRNNYLAYISYQSHVKSCFDVVKIDSICRWFNKQINLFVRRRNFKISKNILKFYINFISTHKKKL